MKVGGDEERRKWESRDTAVEGTRDGRGQKGGERVGNKMAFIKMTMQELT